MTNVIVEMTFTQVLLMFFLCITLNHHLIYFMQYFICVNLCKFTVTVCEADSTTSTESNSTVCYDSDSSNRLDSSGPMFIEDDSDTDNNLPKIQPCSFDGPDALPPPATLAAPGAPASQATPTTTAEKCKCHKNCKDKVFFIQINNFVCFMSIPFLYFYRLNFFIALYFVYYLFLTVNEVQTNDNEEISNPFKHILLN